MFKELESERFSSMNVAGLKNSYLQKCGVTVHGYLKPALIAIATAVNKMMLPIDPNFECHDAGKNLVIHDVVIRDLLHCPRKITLSTRHRLDCTTFSITLFTTAATTTKKDLHRKKPTTIIACSTMVM